MQPFEISLSLIKQTNLMKTKIIFIAALSALFFTSCQKEYFDSGNLITEERVLNDEFSEILIRGSFDVYIVHDEPFDLKIECGERKLEYLDTYVLGDKLYVVEQNNHVANDKQNKIYLNHDYLTKIEIEGSGDFEGELATLPNLEIKIDGSGDVDIECAVLDDVDLNIDGSGDIKLEGTSETMNITIDGSGDIDGRFFEVEEAFIFIDGSGDVKVNATDYLFVQIYGSGDVFYLGDPVIEVNDSGSGDVSPY